MKCEGYDIIRVIVDPSAASFKECIRRHGKFAVWDANNSVLDGIRLTATLLQAGRLKFDESCVNTFEEFGAYMWDEDAGEDAVIKECDHCLTGDTLVDTVYGQVPIKDLVDHSGIVYCTDGKGTKTGYFHDVRMTREDTEVFEIELNNCKKVKATADHPILTRRGWVMLKDLREDDEIACINGAVEYVRLTAIRPAGREPVYNMEVDGYHNFSVNGGVIVHNCMDMTRYFCNTIMRREVRASGV